MNAKSQNTGKAWLDPDDAPELTDDFFEQGVWKVGEKVVPHAEAQQEMARRRGRLNNLLLALLGHFRVKTL